MWKLWNNNLWGRFQDWEFLERKYWQEEIRCERSRALFAGLALLLGGTGKPGAQAGSLNSRVYLDTAAHRFSLSRKERNMLYLIGLHASTAELLLQGHSAKGEWFDFFRSTGNEAAFVLLYAWLSAVDVNNEQNLPCNCNKMLIDFFEKGSTYCPQVPLAVKSLQAVVTCRLGRTVVLHRCPLWLSRAKGIRRCRPASLILSRVMSHLLPSDVAAPGRLRRFTAGGAIPWPASGCKRHRRLPRPCQAPYRPAAGHREPA